jgi:cobalt-precorrin 5A hydrolase
VKIACLSFSRRGAVIAGKIRQEFEGTVRCFTESDYKDHLEMIFREFDGIVFIASTGIAVRLSAPYLKSKTSDPAIVVMDDMGKYAISLVSGHLGGANELAEILAGITDSQAIITTASDGRGIEAVDLFAKRNGLIINDLEAAKRVTALMVDGKRIGFYSDFPATINYPNLVGNHPEACIFVDIAGKIDCSVPFCILRPRILHVGIGCRKGTPGTELLDAIRQVLIINNLSPKCISSLSTIELKKDEPGILEARRFFDCDLNIYKAEEIKSVEHLFETSEFVKETTGVGAVCEPCASLSGDELIVKKTVRDGITIAISKSKP